MVTIVIELACNYGLGKKNLYFEGVKDDATWRPKNLNCILSLQAYLH